MYSNTETSVMTSPMTFTSLMVSEDGAWLQVALGTQQWTKGSQTRTDWWVVSLVNYLSVSPREQESIALILACRCWTSFTVWLVLVRGFGYPMTVSILDRGMLWPVSLTKTYIGNLFAIGKQPQLLHRHSQPSTGLRIPLSICTVIFQFLNTTKLCVVSTSQGPKFLLP